MIEDAEKTAGWLDECGLGPYPYPSNLDLLRSCLRPLPLLLAHMNCILLDLLIFRPLDLPVLDRSNDRLLKRLRSM